MTTFCSYKDAEKSLITNQTFGVIIQKSIDDFTSDDCFFVDKKESLPFTVRALSNASSICIKNIWTRVALSFVVDHSVGEIEPFVNSVILASAKDICDTRTQRIAKDTPSFVCHVYSTSAGCKLVLIPSFTGSLHFVNFILPKIVSGISSHWIRHTEGNFAFPLPVYGNSDETSKHLVFEKTISFNRIEIGCKQKNISAQVVFISEYDKAVVEPQSFPFVFSHGVSIGRST